MDSPPKPTVEDRQRILLESAESMVFKELPGESGGPDLRVHVYLPKNLQGGPPRAAILFFFSSGWDRGHISQFAPQAMYFADRGAVTALVEYRTSSSHEGATPIQAMQDTRSAIRWLRLNAAALNVDPGKIIAAGARAGGHMAAMSAMNPDLAAGEGEEEESGVDGRPDGVVMFSPIVDIDKECYAFHRFETPAQAKASSLSRFIDRGLPPMQIFHGTADRFVPVDMVAHFAKRMKKKKNSCELQPFDGREESFFNLNVDPFSYEAVIAAMDRFLVEHGLLEENEDGEDSATLISWRESDF